MPAHFGSYSTGRPKHCQPRSLSAGTFALDPMRQATQSFSQRAMTIRFALIFVLLAGCSQSPERATIRSVESFMESDKPQDLQAALDTADAYLKLHPDSVNVLRARVMILLKADRAEETMLTLRR